MVFFPLTLFPVGADGKPLPMDQSTSDGLKPLPDISLISGDLAKIEGASLRGGVERVDPFSITGWLVDRKRPHIPLHVEFVVGSDVVAVRAADEPNSAVSKALGLSIAAGFTFGLDDIGRGLDVARRLRQTTFDLRAQGTGSYLAVAEPLPRDLRPVAAPGSSPEQRQAPPLRVIAFYLPQFHPIPENDEWWGKGFTEWTSTSRARPLFRGHYQPHIPADLGYYDLRLPDTRRAQADLARRFGIHGFCYYYYWFAGRKLLDLPLAEVLRTGEPDFPFCICWANETWSRRWDGSEEEVLIRQEHTPETDSAFIADVLPILRDPRYIRVGGAPLLIVYRAQLMPDPATTCERWRSFCAENGIGDIHLCSAETFGAINPVPEGFDSALEFPPHNLRHDDISATVQDLDPQFTGRIVDYRDIVAQELGKPPPPYPRFRGVMLGWDNSPRRGRTGTIFINATPSAYEAWLNGAIAETRRNSSVDHQIVFVNAWNEWAEGAHLEPDQKYGTAYLEATRRALNDTSSFATLAEQIAQTPSISGAMVETFVDRCRTEIAIRDKMIQHLRGLIHDRPLPYDVSRLVASNGAEDDPGPVDSEAMAELEQFGPRRYLGIAEVTRDRLHYVAGWVIFPSVAVGPDTPLCIVVTNSNDSALRYTALIPSRKRQAKVANRHKSTHSGITSLWSGFACYLDWRHVAPGDYAIRLATAATETQRITADVGTVRVIA